MAQPSWRMKRIRKTTTKPPPKFIREEAEDFCEEIDRRDIERPLKKG